MPGFKIKRNSMEVITPETQRANIRGVLNNTIKSGVLNPNDPENTLRNLYDVEIENLQNGDVLIYDEVKGKFINVDGDAFTDNNVMNNEWDIDGQNARE